MNSKVLVSFFNDKEDDYGMPTIYHAYLVIGREANLAEASPGYGIAKVYPISSKAPTLNPDVAATAGGACAAIKEAVQQLKQINSDLPFSDQTEIA